MRSTFKDYIRTSKAPISESLIGKTYAVAQNRAHATNKTKLQSVLSRIQSTAKKGLTEENDNEKFEIIFTLFFDLAAGLKIAAEMSTSSINVSTAGVLDAENLKALLKKIHPPS